MTSENLGEESSRVSVVDGLIDRLLDCGDRIDNDRGGLKNSVIMLSTIISLVVIGAGAMIWQFLSMSPSARRKRDRQMEAWERAVAREHPIDPSEEGRRFPAGIDPASAATGRADPAPTI
jgi:hypothetical protein